VKALDPFLGPHCIVISSQLGKNSKSSDSHFVTKLSSFTRASSVKHFSFQNQSVNYSRSTHIAIQELNHKYSNVHFHQAHDTLSCTDEHCKFHYQQCVRGREWPPSPPGRVCHRGRRDSSPSIGGESPGGRYRDTLAICPFGITSNIIS